MTSTKHAANVVAAFNAITHRQVMLHELEAGRLATPLYYKLEEDIRQLDLVSQRVEPTRPKKLGHVDPAWSISLVDGANPARDRSLARASDSSRHPFRQR